MVVDEGSAEGKLEGSGVVVVIGEAELELACNVVVVLVVLFDDDGGATVAAATKGVPFASSSTPACINITLPSYEYVTVSRMLLGRSMEQKAILQYWPSSWKGNVTPVILPTIALRLMKSVFVMSKEQVVCSGVLGVWNATALLLLTVVALL